MSSLNCASIRVLTGAGILALPSTRAINRPRRPRFCDDHLHHGLGPAGDSRSPSRGSVPARRRLMLFLCRTRMSAHIAAARAR